MSGNPAARLCIAPTWISARGGQEFGLNPSEAHFPVTHSSGPASVTFPCRFSTLVSHFDPEDGGSGFPLNVGKYIPKYTTSRAGLAWRLCCRLYSYLLFCSLPQCGICWDSTSNRPLPLPSRSFSSLSFISHHSALYIVT
jgi:hypothetical protein